MIFSLPLLPWFSLFFPPPFVCSPSFNIADQVSSLGQNCSWACTSFWTVISYHSLFVFRSEWEWTGSAGDGNTTLYGRQDSLTADGVHARKVWQCSTEQGFWGCVKSGKICYFCMRQLLNIVITVSLRRIFCIDPITEVIVQWRVTSWHSIHRCHHTEDQTLKLQVPCSRECTSHEMKYGKITMTQSMSFYGQYREGTSKHPLTDSSCCK